MSKNSFKKEIQQRYKGRGNSWVKVLKTQEGSSKISNHLNNIDDERKNDYIRHTEREGFYWIRFSKIEGNSNEPHISFEVRYRDSREDHPKSTITYSNAIAKNFSLLGNTPFKLQLEVNPNDRKVSKKLDVKKKFIKRKNESLSELNIDLDNEIRVIKEAVLTKPTDRELELWYEFLKLNDLYEENV